MFAIIRTCRSIDIYLLKNKKIMRNYRTEEEEKRSRLSIGEPMMDYPSSSEADILMNNLPREAMAATIRFALEESRAGGGIPHTQVDRMVKDRMGWR